MNAGITDGRRDSSNWNANFGGALSWGDERGGGGGGGKDGKGDGGQARGDLDGRVEGGLGWNGTASYYDDNFVTRSQDRSRNQSLTSGATVSGSSGTNDTDRTYSSNEKYGDTSSTRTSTTGSDWRVAEDVERRRTAAQYREIGSRLVNEADYAESTNFNMSQDMSNLVSDRYRALQQRDPERMLPDLSNPNLTFDQMQRRNDGVREVMQDLMSDIRRRDFSELGDVRDIGAGPPASIGGQPVGIGPLAPPRNAPEGVPALPAGAGVIDGGDFSLVALGRGERATMPVPGAVRSGLGGRVNPVTGEAGQHNGIDIPAARGTPIVLQAGGTVERVDFQAGGAGNYVVINHGNGVLSKYFHMAERSTLVPGSQVSAGDVVGGVGSTGRSTGNHLHYEIWNNGAPVDPRRFTFRRTGEN